MKIKRLPLWCFVGASLGASLNACAVSTAVDSYKYGDTGRPPQNLLVIQNTSDGQRSIDDAMAASLRTGFAQCGVKSTFYRKPILPYRLSKNGDDADAQKQLAAYVANVSPDYIMRIREPYYTARDPSVYKVEYVDRATNNTVWNADVSIDHVGMYSGPADIGTKAAQDILTHLHTDGVLSSCVVGQ